ncbi:MAG: hypothetical protein ACREUN_02035 [Burkholderiales bacterium]
MIGCILVSTPAVAAYDANGVALGASEQAVIKQYPSAHCKPLEWTSAAADRRCDDARVSFGGVEARITFYLKGGAVQAFDVRFDSRHAETVVAFLKSRYGAPAAETRDKIAAAGKAQREIYKVRWEQGRDHAVLTAQLDRRRASLSVSRGDFEEQIYRVR